MILTIDIIDGRGLSNEVRCELLPKKREVILYLPFISQYKTFNQSCTMTLLIRQIATVLKVSVPRGL